MLITIAMCIFDFGESVFGFIDVSIGKAHTKRYIRMGGEF